MGERLKQRRFVYSQRDFPDPRVCLPVRPLVPMKFAVEYGLLSRGESPPGSVNDRFMFGLSPKGGVVRNLSSPKTDRGGVVRKVK
jgi:hypothetical protein